MLCGKLISCFRTALEQEFNKQVNAQKAKEEALRKQQELEIKFKLDKYLNAYTYKKLALSLAYGVCTRVVVVLSNIFRFSKY